MTPTKTTQEIHQETAKEVAQIFTLAKIDPTSRQALEIQHILVTDGSGQKESPVGFSCVGFSRVGKVWTRWMNAGTIARGTVNDAERWGVLVGLDHAVRLDDERNVMHLRRILVISDSTYTVDCIRKRTARFTAGWGILNAMLREGVTVEARHVKRNLCAANREADAVAGSLRKVMVEITSQYTVMTDEPKKSDVDLATAIATGQVEVDEVQSSEELSLIDPLGAPSLKGQAQLSNAAFEKYVNAVRKFRADADNKNVIPAPLLISHPNAKSPVGFLHPAGLATLSFYLVAEEIATEPGTEYLAGRGNHFLKYAPTQDPKQLKLTQIMGLHMIKMLTEATLSQLRDSYGPEMGPQLQDMLVERGMGIRDLVDQTVTELVNWMQTSNDKIASITGVHTPEGDKVGN